MRKKMTPRLLFLGFLCAVLVACSPEMPDATPTGIRASLPATEPFLTPYWTQTATVTPLPPDPSTPTPFPTPTATPRRHVIRQGEDMLGIAWRYGLTLDELMAANPEVDPNFLSVGTELLIPASGQPDQEGELPTPTAAAAGLGELNCQRGSENGLWCFVPVKNTGTSPLESVSASIRLAGQDGVQVAEQTALTPLNLIPVGRSLPLLTYFPPPVPEPFQVNVVLLTAYPVLFLDLRYAPAAIEDLVIDTSADQNSARVSGTVVFPPDTASVRQVWVAAVAYDESGVVIGVRRWESGNRSTSPGEMPFAMTVYSLSGQINVVDVMVEARY